jgi:hypothetical protein
MRAIVNYSTPEYIPGQNRLWASISHHNNIPIVTYKDLEEIGSPHHNQNPYAFKLYTIEHAQKLGFKKILWLDASVYAVKDVTPVFEWMEEKGIFMEEAGHMVGNWCNDFTLNYFGITRQEAMQMPMFAAGYVGFDFTNPISIEFFERWKQSMLDGCFKGSWSDHRHDMSCLSIIANQMNIINVASPGGQFFAYVGEAYQKPLETACFHLQGI